MQLVGQHLLIFSNSSEILFSWHCMKISSFSSQDFTRNLLLASTIPKLQYFRLVPYFVTNCVVYQSTKPYICTSMMSHKGLVALALKTQHLGVTPTSYRYFTFYGSTVCQGTKEPSLRGIPTLGAYCERVRAISERKNYYRRTTRRVSQLLPDILWFDPSIGASRWMVHPVRSHRKRDCQTILVRDDSVISRVTIRTNF